MTEHIEAGDTFADFQISNRDQALFLASERDLEAQLIAIRSALRRNREADRAVTEDIKKLDELIRNHVGDDEMYEMHLQDEWVDALQGSVFQDAAHSMAAVGMLAPFTESLFEAIFDGLHKRKLEESEETAADERSHAARADYWDPHFAFGKGGRRIDLVAGIRQLSDSIGLSPFLPENYEQTLTALFAYRNRMFHLGFEWPLEERRKFDERIRTAGWPAAWFSKSQTGDDPWIFYMTEAFIEHCLTMIEALLEGVGRYVGQQRAARRGAG